MTGTTCPSSTGTSKMSLGKSIQALSPNASAKTEEKSATKQAGADINEAESDSKSRNNTNEVFYERKAGACTLPPHSFCGLGRDRSRGRIAPGNTSLETRDWKSAIPREAPAKIGESSLGSRS